MVNGFLGLKIGSLSVSIKYTSLQNDEAGKFP